MLALIVATGVATMFFLPIVGQVVAGFGGVALAGYVAALWQIQRRRDLRRRVRHLDRARPPAQGRAESSGRRVAVGGS